MSAMTGTDLSDHLFELSDLPDVPSESTRRVRVLVEHENRLVRGAQAATLIAAGFDVEVCPGPRRGSGCPLLASGFCEKAQRADVIVDGLTLGHVGVYAALRQARPDCPVALALSDSERDAYPLLTSMDHTIARNLTGRPLVEAVRALVDAGDDEAV